MAHISSLGAAMFTDLSICTKPHDQTSFNLETLIKEVKSGHLASATAIGATPAGLTAAGFAIATAGLFQTPNANGVNSGSFTRITHIKEFPAIGTPANVVKVPEYGAATSKQIQGQADAPSMELTLNYVPSMWADNKLVMENGVTSSIEVNDGKMYLFRFTLLAKEPEGYKAVVDTASTDDDAISGGGVTNANVGAVENTSYYFLGKLEALEVTPSLTDALSAKLTITVQSDIRGAFTV